MGPGTSERVERDVMLMAGSHSSSYGAMRDCGLRGRPVDEAPLVPHPGRVIMNVRSLLERNHETVD